MSEYCDEKLEKGISINLVGLLDDTEIFYFSSSKLRLLVGWLGGWGVDRVNTLAASCRCPEREVAQSGS